jgi:hypothetical protein
LLFIELFVLEHAIDLTYYSRPKKEDSRLHYLRSFATTATFERLLTRIRSFISEALFLSLDGSLYFCQ